MNKKITAIITAHNSEKYIAKCIDSVLEQTYKNFDIIIVNYGSTDTTESIIKNYIKKQKNIRLITTKNNGKGYARNSGLKKATGEYIMFIDANDLIEPVTFEVAIKRAIEDNSDFVFFDYKYYYDNGKTMYTSKNRFFSKRNCFKEECNVLLNLNSYFTVNKLYKKEFLIKNNIKYGELHKYEDMTFWVKCVLNAKNISLIHSPLYSFRVINNPTTKKNHNIDKEIKDLFTAFNLSANAIIKENDNTVITYLIKHMMNNIFTYYKNHAPIKYKKELIKQFYQKLIDIDYDFNLIYGKSRYVKMLKKLKFIKDKDIFKLYINKSMKKKLPKKGKRNIKFFEKKSINDIAYEKYSKDLKEQILFVGFGSRYTGNGRYLFEKMLSKNIENIYFATNDPAVDNKYRIVPNTEEFYEKLYSSKIVVFESWIQSRFRKNDNAIWINLWHGTPLKKVLFDSNEEEITSVKTKHKNDKYKAIEKMDYIVTDNKTINHYFETSFLFNKNKLLSYGYPRVKYLIENKNNDKLKKEIRKKLNIEENKKIVSYLPTWRDYNYQSAKEYDFEYVLDKEKLEKNLNKDYVILCKDHVFLQRNKNMSIVDIETQELLLISDFLITDYSSVMFDAFAIDTPVCIISKDYEKYSLSRGVYEEIWNDLKPFVVENEKDLSNLIKNYKIDKNYEYVKNKYSYKSDGDIIEFINEKLKEEK